MANQIQLIGWYTCRMGNYCKKKKHIYLIMTTEKQKGSKVYQFTITDQHN